jgi:hypothetical protein
MPKYSIAFVALAAEKQLRHQIIEAADRDAALKEFFGKEALDLYSDDDQGYHYFKEDFSDNAGASIIEIR